MEKVDKEIHSSKMMCEVLNYVNGCSFQSMRDHGREECALLSFLKATKCIYMLILPPAKNTCKEKGAQWQTARRRTHGLLCAAVLSIMCHFPSTDHLPYSFFNTMLWVQEYFCCPCLDDFQDWPQLLSPVDKTPGGLRLEFAEAQPQKIATVSTIL